MFDKSESGLIDGDKLKTILTTMGETLEDDEIKELMKDANIGADGKIAYEGNRSCPNFYPRTKPKLKHMHMNSVNVKLFQIMVNINFFSI